MSPIRIRRAANDALAITVAGVTLALVANYVSPRGLSLAHDYFPSAPPTSVAPAAPGSNSTLSERDARFAHRGLALVTLARAVELFRDPRHAEGRIIFIDARDDRHYRSGHIPGALPLDHSRLADYAADVLAACQIAEHIVVYCTGGNCEDSELAAADLLDFGLPATKVAVFGGGIEEWRARGLPLETGPRNSGVRLNP
ncbi:MAG: hypothetical protein H7343_15650 [Undibacterium sp.]|nr:hypothetical protein [Opitutaceae bacterium]